MERKKILANLTIDEHKEYFSLMDYFFTCRTLKQIANQWDLNEKKITLELALQGEKISKWWDRNIEKYNLDVSYGKLMVDYHNKTIYVKDESYGTN